MDTYILILSKQCPILKNHTMGICSSCCNDSAETENAYSSLLESEKKPAGAASNGSGGFEGGSAVVLAKENGPSGGYKSGASTVESSKRKGGKGIESRPISVPRSAEKLEIAKKTTSEDAECVICLENFSASHPAVNKKCACGRQTRYHLSCILSWKEHSEVCPVCSQKVTLLDENGETLLE